MTRVNLPLCQKIAIKCLDVSSKPTRFYWIGKDRKVRCEWIDPVDGFFKILGTAGFLDMNRLTFLKDKFTHCEIIND